MPVHEPFQFQSLDQLRQRIGELALALDVTENLSPLFDAVRVGPLRLSNRLVVLPMEGCDGEPDGAPGELTLRRYRRFASGGAGLLWMEATAVVPEGRANPRQLWLHADTVSAFARMVEATHGAARESVGSSHRPVLILQLTHSGRYSRPGRHPRPIIAHRSIYLDPLHMLPGDYALISDDELERLEDRYVEAALCAQRAGFDGVDVKACHRYLVSELLASHTREDSAYGGAAFENRSRFLRNVVGKIRSAAPHLLVATRMNAYDAMPYPFGFGVSPDDPGTPDLGEPIELVRSLRESGVPMVNITVGNPYYNPHVNRPFDLPTMGAPLPPESPLEGVARFAGIVRAIQAQFPGLPVVGGGYSWLRQFFPNVAAAHVRNGWVSLVGVGRMAFAYPDFARDLAERGRLDPKRVCVACSACTQIMRDGGRTGCVPRDAAVYEPIYKAGRANAMDSIRAAAATCRQCNDPTCVGRCPAQVDIPKFVAQVAAGDFRGAYETIRKSNVLAAVCGYVCPAETLCEAGCINRHYADPVPIRRLQRWVSDMALAEGWAADQRPHGFPTGRRVAILGAGPAGLAAAVKLAWLGHEVTIMDREVRPGGAARATIPLERLPEEVVRREIDEALAGAGDLVRRRNVELGPAFDLDQLITEGYDAVFLGLGLSEPVRLPGPRPTAGVAEALEYLALARAGSANALSGRTVLVIGGGNTAMDAAVTARRQGAEDVCLIYRRSLAEMPAWPEEREKAVAAGVHFLILTEPVGYVTDSGGGLAGLAVARTRLGEPAEDGRRRPVRIAGSEHVLPARTVIEAIGQNSAEPLRRALRGVEFDARGRIAVKDGSFATTRRGVFAAGDIVNGGATVVEAVAEGTRAAREIHRYLQNTAPGGCGPT